MTIYRITGDGFRRAINDRADVRAVDVSGPAFSPLKASASVVLAGSAKPVALSFVSASSGIAFNLGAPPSGVAVLRGAASLAFTLIAKLSRVGGASTSLTFHAVARPSAMGYIKGDAVFALAVSAKVNGAYAVQASASFSISALGRPTAVVPIKGAAGLSFSVSAKPWRATNIKAATSLTFTTAARPSTNNSAKFRNLWLEVYDKRQKCLTAIDEKNRLLAQTANNKADANATALVATNTAVTNLDGRITAEATRITSLTSRVGTVESGLYGQANAITLLTTRVTLAEGSLSSTASQITTLTTTQNGHTATLTSYGSSIDGLRLKAGLSLNANGHITGWTLNNDGQSGDFTIIADKFRMVVPGATPKIPFSIDADNLLLNVDLYMGNGRIISRAGGFMKVQGSGFGTNNQFTEWYGPVRAINLCDETSAIYYLTNTGSAYFGGTLSAGVKKNAATSTQIGGTAQVETGVFTTAGNQKSVVYSFSFNHTGQKNGNSAGIAGIGVTITLERSYAGGAWQQVGTAVIAGNYTGTYFSEPNITRYRANFGDSYTYTDSTVGTGTFNYRATLSNPTGTWPRGDIVNDGLSQALTVISTEV